MSTAREIPSPTRTGQKEVGGSRKELKPHTSLHNNILHYTWRVIGWTSSPNLLLKSVLSDLAMESFRDCDHLPEAHTYPSRIRAGNS